MVAWAMNVGGGAAGADWFAQRFARARRLMPAANFDTVIPLEFAETVTCELVDVTGVADANPVDSYSGGVVEVVVGDAVTFPSHGRLQLTGSPSHVGPSLTGRSWYAASLVRMIRPIDEDMGDSAADAIGLWSDDNNRVGLGIFGNGSGGSTTNWVGLADVDGSITTVFGPALDGGESPVWHLFEQWFDVDTGELSFALDGIDFDDVISVDDMPSVPARFSIISQRDTAGTTVVTNIDKACVVVASPRVGETD